MIVGGMDLRNDVHTRYMWWIMIRIGEWWYSRHSELIGAHQSGSKSTTYTFYVHHSTKSYTRQWFSDYDILYTSLFYHLTGILNITIWLYINYQLDALTIIYS